MLFFCICGYAIRIIRSLAPEGSSEVAPLNSKNRQFEVNTNYLTSEFK